ncbi:MAG: hypothetical protein ACOC0P_07295, partial [Planctomycetota bacterium]
MDQRGRADWSPQHMVRNLDLTRLTDCAIHGGTSGQPQTISSTSAGRGRGDRPMRGEGKGIVLMSGSLIRRLSSSADRTPRTV